MIAHAERIMRPVPLIGVPLIGRMRPVPLIAVPLLCLRLLFCLRFRFGFGLCEGFALPCCPLSEVADTGTGLGLAVFGLLTHGELQLDVEVGEGRDVAAAQLAEEYAHHRLCRRGGELCPLRIVAEGLKELF